MKIKNIAIAATVSVAAIFLVSCGHEDTPVITQLTTEGTESQQITVPVTEAATEMPTEIPTEMDTEAPTEEPTEHKHDYRFRVTKEPTCSSTGERIYICKVCGASYKETINPLDHAYIITEKASDCTTGGCTTYVCNSCGYTYTDNITEPLGHRFGEWETTVAPTEKKEGLAVRRCERCGELETTVLPATKN